ncbi:MULTISPECIES: hypothetical protein [unclassified Nonomuraea]|uniref:hypothetical protein n=1 Tax=unclassified Nonomuraea TaxID=2593643 RepID=UPI0033D8B410
MHARDEFTPPRPDPALGRLDFLVGAWSLTGQFDSSGETGGALRGTATFRRLPGGFFLVHHWSRTFHLDGHLVQDTGYEFYDYIPETDAYRAHFFTNLGGYDETGNKYLGHFDGPEPVLIGPVRTTSRPHPDGTITQRTDLPAGPGQWIPWLHTQLHRTG